MQAKQNWPPVVRAKQRCSNDYLANKFFLSQCDFLELSLNLELCDLVNVDEVSSYLLTYIPPHVNVVEESWKKEKNSLDILWHLNTFLKKYSLELVPQILIYQARAPGLRAESARAFTGRRNSHSGRGEDFLSRQPNFFTERKVEKWFPTWEINRHAEG